MFCAALAFFAAPASAELVYSLDQDPESGSWTMQVPGWSATVLPDDPDSMTAAISLTPEGGAPITAKVDMLGQNLPLLMNIEEVLVCKDTPSIAVSVADAPGKEGARFTYRRWLFQPEAGGIFLGEYIDEVSGETGGLLPAAVVAEKMTGLCS